MKTRLGAYEILGPLGAGGMGEVYRAKDLRLGREVAVKVLPTDVASSSDRLARFELEARTVAGLNHPNIVTLFSVEDQDGIRFLTMELIEGQSLSNIVTPGGLPFLRILDLSVPLAEALATAHEHGVIHRDLKPSNVMVTRDGRVKVLDFGLAKVMAADVTPDDGTLAATAGVSIAGQVMGTVPYMAPEQVRGGPVDARSDLFALGIILYELATGRRPFTGSTSADVSSSILRDSPEPLQHARPDLPLGLQRIIGRCLEKSPGDRAQTALDVANELRALRHAPEHGGQDQSATGTVASIAVLPFVNRSASVEDEYFSDGLADELLNVLTKIKGLRVTARTSSFRFKGKDTTVAEIGKALNVAAILEGSVRKSGNRARITVQLVKVSDGYQLWSETYDRTLEDILAVQDDIAQSVVKELRTAYIGGEPNEATEHLKTEVARASKGRGSNPEAQRLYLLARHFLDRLTFESSLKGIEYMKEALALDPDFALAWKELGRAYLTQGQLGWVPAAEGYGRGRMAVERALSLEPDLSEGHASLGLIQMLYDWDFRGAAASYSRALELAPGSAVALLPAGMLAFNLGRIDDAIALYQRALEQDPLGPATYNNLGLALYAANRFVEAEATYRTGLELGPQRVAMRSMLSLTLLAQGRGEEALAEAMREPDEAYRLWALALVHNGMGQRLEADRSLTMLTEKHAGDYEYQIAEVHGARGDVDAAFEWLERAYARRDVGLSEMKVTPHFRSLHGDARWEAFLKKMRLDG